MAVSERRERERAERREAILEAAQGLVVEFGFKAVTMNQVARRAQLSKGALYLYFDNKDALCAAVAGRNITSLLPVLERFIADAPTGIQGVRRVHDFYVRHFTEHPHQFRFAVSWLLSGENIESDTPEFAAYTENVGRLLSLIVETLERGKLDRSVRADVDAMLQAKQLWASFLGVFMMHLDHESFDKRTPFPIDTEALLELHVDNLVRALSGPNTGAAS